MREQGLEGEGLGAGLGLRVLVEGGDHTDMIGLGVSPTWSEKEEDGLHRERGQREEEEEERVPVGAGAPRGAALRLRLTSPVHREPR